MKQITLSKGKVALVDDEDYERLSSNKWYCSAYGYAVRTERASEKRITHWMHREVLECPQGMEVDHINGNKLDNRKVNLRICSRKENCKNVSKSKINSSGYKGVSFHKQRNKFRAYITIENKQKWLGYYETALEAAIAYNSAALEYYKEFAKLNEV